MCVSVIVIILMMIMLIMMIVIIIIIIYCTQCLEPRLIIFVHRVQYVILTKTFDLSRSALSLSHSLALTTLTSHHRPLGGERRRKKNARLSALKGRERAIVNQTNIGTVSKAKLEKLLKDWVERISAFPNA